MVHGTRYIKAVRQAQRPANRQKPAETPAGWKKSQQTNREQQNHKLAKKTIHHNTSKTQKAKNIKPPIVPRETMANITIEQ